MRCSQCQFDNPEADCHEVTTAKSDLALPGADIGRNATVLICYL
jgi:hypothetical protein